MGFYGNITNTSKTQFQFDKIYPNRTEMDRWGTLDGIFIGRYVLIEYDKSMSADEALVVYQKTDENGVLRFYSSGDLEANTELVYRDSLKGRYLRVPGIYEDTSGNIIIHNLDDETSKLDIIYVITGQGTEAAVRGEEYKTLKVNKISELENNPYTENYVIDIGNYGPGRGYDSTVWQKVYVDEKERYVMVAELNTIVPTFNVSPDAPTLSPITPHFDVDSTNVYYKVHWQPSWGLRVRAASPNVLVFPMDNQGNTLAGSQIALSTTLKEKLPSDETVAWSRTVYDTANNSLRKFYYNFSKDSDTWVLRGNWVETAAPDDDQYMPAAIYYNKAGFNPALISYSDKSVIDKISIEATGLSGNLYNVHGVAGKQEAQVDTQELSIMLPSLGNSIAKIWDLVYGDEKINGSKTRNMFIDWEEGTLVPQLKGLRLVETKNNGYSFKKANVQTLAGAINSVHDLMGMIIQQKEKMTEKEAQEKVKNWLNNYIYYLSEEGKFYRKSKGYKYTEYADYNPTSYVPYTPVNINRSWSIPNNYFYLDYVPTNPIKIEATATPYPNYMKEINSYYSDRPYYKNAGPKVNAEGFKGSQFMDSFKPNIYFISESIPVQISDSEKIFTTSYRISLDKEYNPKSVYYNISHESLGDNIRFWTKNNLYTGTFQVKLDHTLEDYEAGILFIKDEETGRYTRPASYNPEIIHYSASFTEDDANQYDPNTQYFTVSTVEKEDQIVYIEKIRYVEEPNLTEANFPLYEYYYKIDGVYFLGEKFDSSKTYYRKFVTLVPQKENVNTALPENIIEVDVIPFDSFPRGSVAIFKKGGAGGINGFDEYVLLTEKMLESHTENLVKITVSEIENIYVPYLYYREVTEKEDPYYGSYIIDTSSTCDKDAIYYEKDQMTYSDLVDPTTEGEKYLPNKYYYKIPDTEEYVLDTSESPVADREYCKKNSLYVLSDTSGRFNHGIEWNLNAEKPASVTLGRREDVWELQELKEFARNYNTIHGLILRLNQILDLDNPESRNLDTVQGALNSVRDVLGYLHNIKPNEIMVTDRYGRFTTRTITTDKWLEATYSDDSSIDFKHLYLGDNTALSGESEIEVAGESADKTLNFGGTFTSPTFSFKTDDKGHLNSFKTSSTTITMPTLDFTTDNGGNVVIGLSMTPNPGTGVNKVTFGESRKNVGTLALTEYVNPSENNITSIVNTDSINGAFGKIEKVLKEISGDEWIKPVLSNGSIKFEHKNTGTSYTNPLSMHEKEDDLNLTFGGEIKSPYFSITVDETGHIDEYATGDNILKLPTLTFTNATADSGNVITGISMSEGNGATNINFTETRSHVGTLALTGYAHEIGADDVTGIEATDSINEAFSKINSVLDNCDCEVTADSNFYISQVKQENGKVSATTSATTNITKLGTITEGVWQASTLDVPYGGTGVKSFTAGEVLIGDGTNPITTRGITDLTTEGTITADNNLITGNTLVNYVSNLMKNYTGQTNITSVGTITTGIWQGTAITSDYIADDAITSEKIAESTIINENIADETITSAKLASGISATKITDGILPIDVIDDKAITGEKLQEKSINNSHLADDIEFEATKVKGALEVEVLSNAINTLLTTYKNPITDEEGNEIPIENLNILPEDSILMALTKLEQRIQKLEEALTPPAE